MDINKGDHIEYRFKRFSIVLRTYLHDGRYQNLNIDSVTLLTLFFNKLIAILTQESFIHNNFEWNDAQLLLINLRCLLMSDLHYTLRKSCINKLLCKNIGLDLKLELGLGSGLELRIGLWL